MNKLERLGELHRALDILYPEICSAINRHNLTPCFDNIYYKTIARIATDAIKNFVEEFLEVMEEKSYVSS